MNLATTDKTPDPEDLAAEFLFLAEEGQAPDLDGFLASVPEAIREEVGRLIEELRRLSRDLDAAGEKPVALDAPAPDPPHFRILGLIGEGALATVHAAWDEKLERKVALKILKGATSGPVLERILAEARRAAGLDDPGIVTIHAVTETEGRPAIVMELIEGYPVDRAAKSLNWRQKARLLLRIARGLGVAHRRGIIHRDLKPDNILVTPEQQPKILDFGLAISIEGRQPEGGGFVGTPLYASPEQAAGGEVTAASDIFSFGSVMFCVLTGRPPFRGESVAEVLGLIRNSDPPFPRTVAAGVPLDLQAVCLACLALDAGDRPDAEEIAADLDRYLSGEPARLQPTLYRDILRNRISKHTGELATWRQQGIISDLEQDSLGTVYRRILADQDPWLFDSRRLSYPQTLLYAATWAAVVGVTLLVTWAWDDLSVGERLCFPLCSFAALLILGISAQRKREVLAAATFLAGAVLALVPAVVTSLVELGWLGEAGEGIDQLLRGGDFTNRRLLLASTGSLVLSAACLRTLRLTAFAWTTAVLVVTTWLAFLLTRDLLDMRTESVGLLLLPLLLLEIPALTWESRGHVRWALPFHLIALVTLVLSLDLMALEGGIFERLGLVSLVGKERAEHLGFALAGLVLLAAMLGLEGRRSLDLRRGARILSLVVPVHLLASLFVIAQRSREGWDTIAYLAATALLLVLGPWRNRRLFLTGGLAGIAFGSMLLIDIDLVEARPFTMTLSVAGVVAAAAVYVYLLRRRR